MRGVFWGGKKIGVGRGLSQGCMAEQRSTAVLRPGLASEVAAGGDNALPLPSPDFAVGALVRGLVELH